jgi:hypothetical protein
VRDEIQREVVARLMQAEGDEHVGQRQSQK